MKKTIRLTTAQALVRFLNQQYLSVDGKESLFVDGVFHIFGHGNVLGIGQALEQNPGSLKIIQKDITFIKIFLIGPTPSPIQSHHHQLHYTHHHHQWPRH